MKNLNKWKWRYKCVMKHTYIYENKINKKEYTLYSSDFVNHKYKKVKSISYYYLNRNYYRHPKTLNELKQYDRKYSRACRSGKKLRMAWDDIPIKEYKSWKHISKRKYQWKNIKHSRIRQEMLNNPKNIYKIYYFNLKNE